MMTMTDATHLMTSFTTSLRTHWRRYTKWCLIAGGALFLVAIPFVWAGWNSYASEAANIDLSAMRKVREGTPVLDRNGLPAGSLFSDREFVKLSEVPQHLVDALIATEDARFYEHDGLDFSGIARAMMKNVASFSVKQGGSTITQQLARQAFELKGRTLHRKLLESFVASRIEATYSKEEILESYLNRIYLGSGFYGIGSAARGYFDKDIKDLTLEEAALLVGIIKAPISYSPFKDMAAAKRTRDLTLHRMKSMKMIAATRCAEAQATMIEVMPENTRLGRQNYLLAAVERNLEQIMEDGRSAPLKSVSVTVDSKLQSLVDAMVGRHVKRVEEDLGAERGKLQGAAVVIDNRTGEILATCGGRDFLTSPFDRATKGQREAGTAFIPLAFAAIIAHQPKLAATYVLDAPLDNRRVMVGGDDGVLGEWGTETSQPVYEGYVPALYGLLKGKAGVTVRLGYEAGLDGVKSELDRCGFSSPLREQASLLLGSSPVRLIDMARAYASLAQDGALPAVQPLVVSVEASRGNAPKLQPRQPISRVFTKGAASQVRNVLVASLAQPDRQRVLQEYGLSGRGLAGWGGTAHGFSDAWYIGFDQNVTCAVWMGFDEDKRMGNNAWSSVTAFPLWAELMAASAPNVKGWLPAASAPNVCLLSGHLSADGCRRDPRAISAMLSPELETYFKRTCTGHQNGTALRPPLFTMQSEVAPSESLLPARSSPAPQAAPISPVEPALIGQDPYKALSSAGAP